MVQLNVEGGTGQLQEETHPADCARGLQAARGTCVVPGFGGEPRQGNAHKEPLRGWSTDRRTKPRVEAAEESRGKTGGRGDGLGRWKKGQYQA